MTIRIAMWSGPRNLSTAMMRAFENRPDCAVIDEPFYAAYLATTGACHPMRDDVLAAQSSDWRDIAHRLVGPAPGGKAIFYQKHMTHHMLPEFGRDWMAQCRHAFLIRAPEKVLASYSKRRESVTLDEIGFRQQAELFARQADRLGHAPPVLDADDILTDPPGKLAALCAALGIALSPSMLSWPAGPRSTDGAWAPAWYHAVWNSTGFAAPRESQSPLSPALRGLAQEAGRYYVELEKYKI
jgi:hypothetical protein